jgi:hypothetical protein
MIIHSIYSMFKKGICLDLSKARLIRKNRPCAFLVSVDRQGFVQYSENPKSAKTFETVEEAEKFRFDNKITDFTAEKV